MKKTHTFGRWAVRAGDRGKKTVIVPHVNGYSVIAERVDGPNARLIAAAPELLEVLKVALEVHGGDVFFGPDPDEHSWCAVARAAIAKAERR